MHMMERRHDTQRRPLRNLHVHVINGETINMTCACVGMYVCMLTISPELLSHWLRLHMCVCVLVSPRI